MEEITVARFSVRNAPGMTEEGRRDIAEWLIRQAINLIDEGEQYTSGMFHAKWMALTEPYGK